MRADTTHTRRVSGDIIGYAKTQRDNDYIVSPILVRDLTTAFAAYFMDWFTTSTSDHIVDVVKCGRNDGGMVDEVEYFHHQCEEDIDYPDNALGYWPIEVHGPWIFGEVSAAEVAEIILEHTRDWTPEEFTSYGYTRAAKAALDPHISSLDLGSVNKRE